MNELKFYRCNHCGNIIVYLTNKNVPVVCCGEKMNELVANSVDAAVEKHVPIVEVNGNVVDVTVGSVIHPMMEAHHIEWIALLTNQGYYVKHLAVDGAPKASFSLLNGEKVVAAYEYCNLHGLWKKEM